VVVGAPLMVGSSVHGCAIVIHRGKVLGVVPKTYLPNYREFYEKRQFGSSSDALADTIEIAGQSAPFGVDLSFEASDLPGFVLGVEICEDVWAPIPPSTFAAMAGATVIANLSASNITIGKAAERDMLCVSQSARGMCAYVYSAAGYGESTTDTAWDGQLAIYQQGATLAESDRFADASALLVTEVDLDRIVQDRALGLERRHEQVQRQLPGHALAHLEEEAKQEDRAEHTPQAIQIDGQRREHEVNDQDQQHQPDDGHDGLCVLRQRRVFQGTTILTRVI
jgi:predicted amidohydrolase